MLVHGSDLDHMLLEDEIVWLEGQFGAQTKQQRIGDVLCRGIKRWYGCRPKGPKAKGKLVEDRLEDE
jgi:hypothetical protein